MKENCFNCRHIVRDKATGEIPLNSKYMARCRHGNIKEVVGSALGLRCYAWRERGWWNRPVLSKLLPGGGKGENR